MPSALIVAPILLAVVLVVSGLAKVRDRAGVQRSFRDLGVPRSLDRAWIRAAFPWGEVALGLALLVCSGPLAGIVASVATLLMVTYLLLIWRAWRRPEQVDCNCFGSSRPSRVTGITVARNATLVAIGLAAVADATAEGPVVLRALQDGTPAWLVAVGLSAWLTFAITREEAPEAPTVPPAPVPVPATTPAPGQDVGESEADDLDYIREANPSAVLLRPDGDPLSLAHLTSSRPVLMIWLSFTCGACQTVIERIPSWVQSMPQVDIRVALTDRSQVAAAPEELRDLIVIDPFWTLGGTVHTFGTPSAVLFGADGLTAGGPVSGSDDVADLVGEMQESLAEAAQLAGADPRD